MLSMTSSDAATSAHWLVMAQSLRHLKPWIFKASKGSSRSAKSPRAEVRLFLPPPRSPPPPNVVVKVVVKVVLAVIFLKEEGGGQRDVYNDDDDDDDGFVMCFCLFQKRSMMLMRKTPFNINGEEEEEKFKHKRKNKKSRI